MSLEIERKFLVVGEYKHLAHSSIHIAQGYIASGHATVRVRLSDRQAWLTIKGPSRDGGLTRYEWEHEIDGREALELLQLAQGATIDKHRYFVEYHGHTFEVDEFHGENEGLTIAEVEMKSADESVDLPEWLGREVTGLRRYYNSHLRHHPYCTWNDNHR